VAYSAEKTEKDETDDDDIDEVKHKLPDGNVIAIGKEKYRAPECLFNPALLGLEYPGVHMALSNSISKCDLDIRRTMYSSIVLAGGTTLFEGMCDCVIV